MTLRWVALGVLAALALVRLAASFDPLPGWGVDPAVTPAPIVGMGPAASIAIDVALLTLAAGAMALDRARRSATEAALAIGALASAGGALLHGGLFTGGWAEGLRLDDLRLGLAWSGAFAAALCAARLAREPMQRRALVALLLGAGLMLAAKGAMQVFVEHESTVRSFRADREGFLAGQGWSSDSAQARAFERRLSEPAPTGFVGLTNVYLSVTLACAVGLAAWVVRAWREPGADPVSDARTRHILLALGAIAAAACAATALFGPASGGSLAKGPIGALVLALAALAAMLMPRVPVVLARLAPAAIVATPWCAVVARGLIGERLGELSLLFRWFYTVGAARIIASDPIIGVGPDGFQRAYMIAKPAISPESVVSPHAVLLDWLATLGLFGAAMGVAWLVAVSRLARAAAPRDDRPAHETLAPTPAQALAQTRQAAWWLVGVILVILVWQFAWEEWPIASAVDGATALIALEGAVRLAAWGLAWGVGAGAALALGSDRAVRIAAVAASLLVVAHAQIEMTLTTPGSATWAMALLGAALAAPPAAGRGGTPARARGARWMGARVIGAGGLVIAAAAAASVLPTVIAWESQLRNAARRLHEVAQLDASIRTGALPFETAATRLEALGAPRPSAPDRFGAALETLRAERAAESLDQISRAALCVSEHPATLRAGAQTAASMGARLAALPGPSAPALGERARGFCDQAVALAERATVARPDQSGVWSSLGAALRARAAAQGERTAAGTADLDAAAAALSTGDRLDPHGVDFPIALADLLAQGGDLTGAARWAAEALRRDENLRLDPVAQLSDRDRRRLERLAALGESGG